MKPVASGRWSVVSLLLLVLLAAPAAADWYPGDPPPAWEWRKDYNHYPACGTWTLAMPCEKGA
jgi:hypothetical protein